MKALHRQLKEKSIKSRQGCFSLLTELAGVAPGVLGDHIPALIPGDHRIPTNICPSKATQIMSDTIQGSKKYSEQCTLNLKFTNVRVRNCPTIVLLRKTFHKFKILSCKSS